MPVFPRRKIREAQIISFVKHITVKYVVKVNAEISFSAL
jgi:hypothetical protein